MILCYTSVAIFCSKTELFCRVDYNSLPQSSGMKSVKNNLGYLSFTLWRALIFFEINDDYTLLLKDLSEINCCSASLKHRFCIKVLNLGFRHPLQRTLIWKQLKWGFSPEGVPQMVYILLCSVTVTNVKALDSQNQGFYPVWGGTLSC